MIKVNSYITEKLKISKDSKSINIKEYIDEVYLNKKCLLIISKAGEDLLKYSYLDLIIIDGIKYNEEISKGILSLNISYTKLTNIFSINRNKQNFVESALYDENDNNIFFSSDNILYKILDKDLTKKYFEQFKKDKFYRYKDFAKNANLDDDKCEFNMTNSDFEKIEKALNDE